MRVFFTSVNSISVSFFSVSVPGVGSIDDVGVSGCGEIFSVVSISSFGEGASCSVVFAVLVQVIDIWPKSLQIRHCISGQFRLACPS